MNTKTLVIGEDLDGFLGYDSEAISKIDVEASKEKYEEMLSKKIKEFYSDIEIKFNWDGESDYYDFDDPEEIQTDLEWMEDVVYNSQDFWVMKEE